MLFITRKADSTLRTRIRTGLRLLAALTCTAVLTPGVALAAPQPSAPQAGTTVVRTLADGSTTTYLAPAKTKRELQSQIDDHLRRFPGGVQINENEISYNGGSFVMTFAKPNSPQSRQAGTQGTNDCPLGWYCFWDGINFTYPRGILSDCGWQDLFDFGWHDRTESVAQTSPNPVWVTYSGHEGTTPDHSGDDVYFFTDGSARTISAVPVNVRNAADHAYKNCPLLTEQ